MASNRTLWLISAGAITAEAVGAAVWFWRGTNWGSTAEEREKALPGDETVPNPIYRCTRAITIDAEPRHVWPWLMQMGNGRGGLYSVDWLDRVFGILDGPSAEEILPEHQHLEAGDVIPIGRGDDFPVTAVEMERLLVLSGEAEGARWLWSFVLEPLPEGGTRLLSRNRASFAGGPWVKMFIAGVDMASTIMSRQMLLNLKRRAERLKRAELTKAPGWRAAV